MVEFGAGGNISQPVEPVTPVPAAAAEGNETTGAAAGGADAIPPVITPMAAYSPTGGTTVAPVTNSRRKRKAKGWFCPVCRQPYTSLLRITTAAPPPLDKEAEVPSDADEAQSRRAAVGTDAATAAAVDDGGTSERSGGGGLLSGAFARPGFLRNMSFGRGGGNAQAPVPGDVESQAGMTRVGA